MKDDAMERNPGGNPEPAAKHADSKGRTPPVRPMLSPDDFAAALGIGRRTFQTWRAKGILPPPNIATGKTLRWTADRVEKYMREGGWQ